jgi:hypothetical protein
MQSALAPSAAGFPPAAIKTQTPPSPVEVTRPLSAQAGRPVLLGVWGRRVFLFMAAVSALQRRLSFTTA